MTTLIISCTGRRTATATEGFLTIALDVPPRNLHPHFAFDLNSQLADELLWTSLITLDKHHVPVCTELCADYEFKDDARLVFTLSEALRAGRLRFADNTPITPEDIIASLNILKDPECPFKGAFEIIKKVTHHPPDKLELTLSEVKPSILVDLFLAKIIKKSQAVFPPVDPDKLTASGPYTLVAQTENSLTLQPNPHWPDGNRLMPLKLEFIRDDQTRIFKFIRGEVDVIFNAVPYHAIEDLTTKYNAHVQTTPGINIIYLGVNTTHPELKDPDVRRFIFESVNVPDLLQYKLHGFARAHFSILPIGSPFLNKTGMEANIRQKAPETRTKQIIERLKKTPLTIKSSNAPTSMGIVSAIRAQLEEAGMNISYRPQEFGSFMEDLNSGNFDLFYMSFVGITDPSAYFDFFHSQFIPPAGRNRTRFANKQWDTLSERLARETDLKRRKDLSFQLQALFEKELPIIPMWVLDNIIVTRPSYRLKTTSARKTLLDFTQIKKK